MICPACNANDVPDNSRFCNMCGVDLNKAFKLKAEEYEKEQRAGNIPLIEKNFFVGDQKKTVKVLCKDITEMTEEIDMLTISAYPYSYGPTPRSLIGALYHNLSISVNELAKDPLFDLRKDAGCWISKKISGSNIRRIGGVEIPINKSGNAEYERQLIKSIKSYMHLLDILTEYEPDLKVVVLPLLGTGDLHLDHNLLVFPLINEVLKLLSHNKIIEKVIFVERNYDKARMMADTVNRSYNLQNRTEEKHEIANGEQNIFISYTEKGDRGVADMLANSLKEHGIRYWYAPKDEKAGRYGAEIVKGIRNCTHFICILSENSMKSFHVLNEVDLACKRINEGIKIIPVKLEDIALEPSFEYYFSSINQKIFYPPPIEERIEELLENCIIPEE